MKSEHRHQLQTNDLGKLTERVGQRLDAYYNQILWGVCAVLLVSAAAIYWIRSSKAAEAAAWTELASCNTPEEFADVAKNHAGTRAAGWASLHEADGYLNTGIKDTFTNREKALADLKKGQEIYQDLVDRSSLPAGVRERALFGLGRVSETMSTGDLEPALKAYEQLVKEFPDSTLKDEAERRIAALKQPGTKAFYAWFAKQNPKPPEPPKPQDGSAPGTSRLPDALLPGGLPRLDEGEGAVPKASTKPAIPPELKDLPTGTKPGKPEADKPEAADPDKPAPPATPKPESDEKGADDKPDPADQPEADQPESTPPKAEPESKTGGEKGEGPAQP